MRMIADNNLSGKLGSVYVSRLRNVDTRVLRCVLSSHINGAGLHASGQLATPSNFWGRQSELQSRKIGLYILINFVKLKRFLSEPSNVVPRMVFLALKQMFGAAAWCSFAF